MGSTGSVISLGSTSTSVATNSSELWKPIQGTEAADLLKHLGLLPDAQAQLVNEAIGVLGRCAPPSNCPDEKTGLVTGYVQSGKTMSFTTVAALARDNGFRIIIVIAGTS